MDGHGLVQRAVSDVARVEGTVGAYLAGIPLHRSPGTPQLPPVHHREPRIPLDGEEGLAWSWLGMSRLVSAPVVTSSLDPKKRRNSIS